MACFLLISFPLGTEASVDSNESIKDYLEREKNDSDPSKETDSNTIGEQEKNTPQEASSSGVFITAWDYIKMIFALLFVIALLYGLLRFLNKRNRSFQHNQLIHNLGGVGVGQGKSIQLMQIGNSLYLVGIGENINLLKEITDPQEIEELTKLYEDKLGTVQTLPYIMELMNKLTKNKTHKAKNNENPSFNETFQKKLDDIKRDRSEVLKDWKTKERKNNE
ncbi:flagellar biosynthetic protein FliO [Psychrobacillus sp. MER TA 171]|uniref:flagellar biosynthetic protein FliO n=1 Tax=Psychrobacillus sp. MER TA 171 TaxID=2939577 RepID=UPI002041F0FE|nr:flagellar biosynthetic protein FliO [Psychrobacillus sp. MER TA 171]MCM3356920.1 flagellar biosynthetic protein FliO [Psychrobacillus sp. MER TA 171]